MIYLEDCTATLYKDITYDYVITSPPDYAEIGITPDAHEEYKEFLSIRFEELKPKSNIITILVTDRKYDGVIVQKHETITEIMNNIGWELISQKIWVRSFKKNLYRLNYTFILTFRKGKSPFNPILPDVFHYDHKAVGTYKDNFSIDLVITFINSYTAKEQTVYDPFMGSGSTAIACLETNRNYIGSEIVPEVYQLCNETISEWTYRNRLWAPEKNMIGG